MAHSGRTAPGLVVAALLGSVLAACGDPSPAADADGTVDATPRALASVVIDHVATEPRRETGRWADWSDPGRVDAQVDFGADPEDAESGETRTVRVFVADKDGYSEDELAAIQCTRLVRDRCEQSTVDGAQVLYSWEPGARKEQGGSYAWTVVRDDEVVSVQYETSGLLHQDPRRLDLPVTPDELRAAALDPAMSLHTTMAAYDAGKALDGYEGEEAPPEQPDALGADAAD